MKEYVPVASYLLHRNLLESIMESMQYLLVYKRQDLSLDFILLISISKGGLTILVEPGSDST